jgi:trimeric autotransporter adhesin
MVFFLQINDSVAQNIGINTNNPVHARLEINGSIGASVAMFGMDKTGVTISADYPEIGFNYFYNNGTYTIKAGYAAYVGMIPFNGELYIGGFNGNQSGSDFGPISGVKEAIRIRQDGMVGIGTSTPTFPLTVKGLANGGGLVQESNDGTAQIGFWTGPNAAYLQTWTNTDMQFATGNGAAKMVLQTDGNFRINQSVDIGEKLTRPATGIANLLPLAYGKINGNGTILSGTPNVTINKIGEGQYELSLNGEANVYANSTDYFVFVTPDFGAICTYVIKSNNTIEITTWSTTIQYTDLSCGCNAHSQITNQYAQQKLNGSFQFVVYKYN